jgi:AAA15 family ATPase/GTPase
MIISFKIENFRSIKEPLTLNLTTENRLKEDNLINNSFIEKNTEILKSLLIYGRNASGKSNVLLAINALIYLVKSSDSFKHEEKMSPYEPFLFDSNSKKEPVRFEIDFITVENKTKFKYIISFNGAEIVSEGLYISPFGTQSKLFERNKRKVTYGEYYKGAKKKIENDLLPNQLFLSKSSSSNIKYLDECYLYFKKHIYVATIHDTEYDDAIKKSFSELLLNDKKLKCNLLELLRAADTAISDFSVVENKKQLELFEEFPEEIKKHLLERYQYEVKTQHSIYQNGEKIGDTVLDLNSESFGTKKLFIIGGLILNTLKEGGVIIIDELDKGFHPILTKLLINLFNSKKNNPNNAQLIFATHDSSLLDLEMLRRDQICFVDKTYDEQSILYKLSDIKGIRKDTPVDKWYLSGRFRGIPVTTQPILEF